MEYLSENPHLQDLLARQDITLTTGLDSGDFFRLSQSGFGVFANIGQIRDNGVIVGATAKDGKYFYVIYDPAKEGEDGALTLEEIV